MKIEDYNTRRNMWGFLCDHPFIFLFVVSGGSFFIQKKMMPLVANAVDINVNGQRL